MHSTNNNFVSPRLLFLDDLRIPTDCLNYMDNRRDVDLSIYSKQWHIVRTYAEFVRWIETHGLPDFISFDHDLADFYDDGTQEYTGMDCAKWVVEYCLDNNEPCPDFVVHSANPVGINNITSLLNNFINMQNKQKP